MDMTFGTNKMYKRPVLVAYKYTGSITEDDRAKIRKSVYPYLTDGGMMTSVSTDGFGHGVLFVFDAYMVEELGFFKRCLHTLRVFTAAIAGYIGMSPVIKVIILK